MSGVAGICAPLAAGAQEHEHPQTPRELSEIEEALAADAAEKTDDDAPTSTAASLLPDISVSFDGAFAWFSDDEPLQTGAHDPTQNGFNLQQVELTLGKSVDPYFRFDSNIIFMITGVEVEEAFATTLALPWNLQLRAGQMLTRFGRINPTHPHQWDFVDQPFSLGKVFGGEGNRGLGVELSVLLPLPWYVEIIGSTTNPFGADTARSFYGGADVGIGSPLDLQNTLMLEQFFELGEDWSLYFGLSAANGPNASGKDARTDVYGADLYLKYRPVTRASDQYVALQTEWLYRRRQVPFGVLQDAGGYAFVVWKFARRWASAIRYEHGTPTFDGDGDITIDPLDPEQTADRHRGSSNVTFWPTEFSRIRVQGSVDLPGWRPEPIWAGFLALEVLIGSHAAHRY